MKKKIPTRLITALLLFSVTLSQSSCGFIVWNDGKETTESNESVADTDSAVQTENEADRDQVNTIPTTPADEARIRLSVMPNRHLNAESVIIATADNITVCPDNSETDPVIRARADAVLAVEEKYSTSIVTVTGTPAEILNSAREAHNAEMFYADIMAVPLTELGAFYAEDILANLYSLPYIDYSAEYFDADITAAAIAGDGLYAVSGDANLNPDYLSCVYFNRALAEEYIGEDIYALVKDGTWTWDRFAEFSKLTEDIDGLYGHGSLSDKQSYIDIAASSAGINYVSNEINTVPYVNYLDNKDSSPARSFVETLRDLFVDSGTYTKKTGTDALGLFINQSMLFMTDRLYVTEWLSDSSFEWGILPLPKYDESQENYISPLSVDSPVFCVPMATRSYEISSVILESLNVAAYNYTTDVYIEKCTDYFLRDNNSILMLEIICDTASADFAHMYASAVSSLKNATYGAVYRAATTRSTLDALYRNYKGSANYALSSLIEVHE